LYSVNKDEPAARWLVLICVLLSPCPCPQHASGNVSKGLTSLIGLAKEYGQLKLGDDDTSGDRLNGLGDFPFCAASV
jgi:hypothetical protein